MGRRNLTLMEINRRGVLRRRIVLTLGIAGSLYLIIPLLLGDMGVLKYIGMLKQYYRVSSEIMEMKDQNRDLQREIEALRSDPETIERIARERLGMVRDGELIYKFSDSKK